MIKLPRVRGDRRAKFEKYSALNGTFDYYGLERGGHFAVLEWLLALGGKPYMHVPAAKSNAPQCTMYHPSGWFSMLGPPTLMALNYGPDQDITCPFSRIDSRKVVLSIRDIRNCIASRLRFYDQGRNLPFRVDSAMTHIWKAYAQQVLGDVDYFNGRCVSVLFDEWAWNDYYRSHLVTQLSNTFDWTLIYEAGEAQMKHVSRQGGGSSFDQMEHAEQAYLMPVRDRWKTYADDERYKRVMTDEVLELNQRLLEEAWPVSTKTALSL